MTRTYSLNIENGVAAVLGSSHIPLHLLCKAHTVNTLNGSNINFLPSLESPLKFREDLESINPGVKSFYDVKNWYSCVPSSQFSTLLVMINYQHQQIRQSYLIMSPRDRKQSQALVITPRTTLYQTWLLLCLKVDALPYMQMVLNEIHLSNLHTEIVLLFLDRELLTTKLFWLLYFTHKGGGLRILTLITMGRLSLATHGSYNQLQNTWD